MKIRAFLKKTRIYVFYKKLFPYSFKEMREFKTLYNNAFKIVKNYKHPNTNNINENLIVSLTTYPARIKSAGIVIASIMNQTLLPDKIVLTLSSSQFPKRKLPRLLKKEIKAGLEIIWTEDDLKSHKKYFYVMQKYPENIIITVDDDNLYETKLIQELYDSYKKFPNCISCSYAHKIEIQNDRIMPYKNWTDNSQIAIPSVQNLAVGVGGILYPPKIMDDSLFDKEKLLNCCPFADDIWLKCNQINGSNKIKVVQTSICNQHSIPTTQNTALYFSNIYNNENDEQINNLQKECSFCDKLLSSCESEVNSTLNPISFVNSKVYGFVILHYLAYEMTKQCIERLINLYSNFNIQIVCVDNGSTNDSFEKLKLFFNNHPITFIHNNKNLGFAQGNNIGYLYLKANYSCDYIIVMNNDVLFEDENSLIKIDELHIEEKYAVLGPDIYNPKTNVHQNPSYNYNIKRLYGRTISDIKARNTELKQNYSHFFIFYITDKLLKIRHKYFHWVRKIIPKKNVPPADIKLDSIDQQMENVVLHGACYIFSKDYINKRKFAFNPNTFLYFEEDILHYECQLESLKMIYTPEIKVQHLEDVSTDLAFKKQYNKDKMVTKELINSTNVYINIYEEQNKKEL